MYPPVFNIISSDVSVTALLGTNPVRMFSFGSAPDRVVLPYAVWHIVSGEPENYLGETPDMDSYLVQIDVYGSTPGEARVVAQAVSSALESTAYVMAWRGERRDTDSGNYRYSFDANFYVNR
jgi:hypothetical protein